MDTLTYIVREGTAKGTHSICAQRGKKEAIVIIDSTRSGLVWTMGKALHMAAEARYDYGNTSVKLVIEVPGICNVDPIKIKI